MAPNSYMSTKSTSIDNKYLRRISKSKGNKNNENFIQAENIQSSNSYNVNCARKSSSLKKSPTTIKKRQRFSLFKPFGCGQCRMRFIQMDQLKKHVRFHEQEKKLMSSKDGSLPSSQNNETSPHTCCFPGCNKMLKTHKALVNHIRKVHPSD